MILAAPIGAQQDADLTARCEKYLKTALPAEAEALQLPGRFPSCHSLWLYYGLGGQIEDHEAARKCAWQERAVILKEKSAQLGGPGDFGLETLANIYANGVGVDRSIPLALRFACESAELVPGTGQIEALEALVAEPAPRTKKDYFNMCEGDSTTPAVAVCAEWDKKVGDEERLAKIQRLSASWPQAQQSALAELVKAEAAYSSAHANGEIDLSGSGWVVWEIEAEQGLRDSFLEALYAFEKGRPPTASPKDSAKADKGLNCFYRKVVAEAGTSRNDISTIRPEGIRLAEQAWLRYRDAWIVFAKLRYPSVSAGSWLTLLTNDRIAILKDVPSEMGIDIPSCMSQGDEVAPRPLR